MPSNEAPNVQGLVPPVGRVLMVSYPVGAAIVASGWGRLFEGGQPSSRAAWPGPSRSPMSSSS
jgi:hypothetical protein